MDVYDIPEKSLWSTYSWFGSEIVHKKKSDLRTEKRTDMRVTLETVTPPDFYMARSFKSGTFLIQDGTGAVYQRVESLGVPGLICVMSGVATMLDDGKLYRALRLGERVTVFGEQ